MIEGLNAGYEANENVFQLSDACILFFMQRMEKIEKEYRISRKNQYDIISVWK